MLGPGLGERLITGSNMFTHGDYYELVRLMLRHGLHFSGPGHASLPHRTSQGGL